MAINNFYRGDTQKYRITLKDSTTGEPIDLTGGTIWFTIKAKSTDEDADAIVQKSETLHIDASNGVSEIVVDAEDTINVEPGSYVYDFEFINSSGEVKTFDAGKVKILADITRRI